MVWHRIGIGLLALEVLVFLVLTFSPGAEHSFGGTLVPVVYLAIPGILLFADDRKDPSRAFTITALVFLLFPVLLVVLLLLLVSFSGGRLGC